MHKRNRPCRRTLLLGSISEGTMRHENLIPTFMDTLEYYNPRRARSIRKEYADVFAAFDSGDGFEESEDSYGLVDTLFTALDELPQCPPYVYFGACEGDGASYGFWVSWDSLQDGILDGSVRCISSSDSQRAGLKNYRYVLEDRGERGSYTLRHTSNGRVIWSI